ncbi:uncharacterized protein LOC123699290 [Colias croceus]|uniref:uncharacterized protein LOC123699290 n=1 Tax=Colias crocea TaxID=72248 RepID=UPI001E27DDD5|nr:uncharacterized protein LOC123699290 [Colias croceus]
MSDSEDDNIFPNNVITFQNGNTTISARGPGINKSNMTGLSFRSNVLTSTLNMGGNTHRHRFGNPQYDQRSLYHGRETSPMSMRSDLGPRNFHNSYYPRAMSSQRSLINGRSGSPLSVRSIDTTTSVSAVDIANAFKYMKFNNHELRIIKDAYQKLMRNKVRKRIEKRRNLKLFLRGVRRKSGYDSGEQGSDSSLSSDDGRSVKTSVSYRNAFPIQQLNRIDESLLRTSLKETDIYNDCTDNIKQNTLRNVFPVYPKPVNKKPSHIENSIEMQKGLDNPNGTMTLKDRFTTGFLLPSQRFNKSKPNVTIDKSKNGTILPKTTEQIMYKQTQNINVQSHSDDEQIFPEKSVRANGNSNLDLQKKRLMDEEESISERKRSKIDNNFVQSDKRNDNQHSDFDDNDFMFKKPSMPVRKSNKTQKHNVTEVLISKSSQQLTQKMNQDSDSHTKNLQDLDSDNNNQTVISQNSSDVSMKPSFIKRKLFTQKLDLLENKNLNSDLAAPSPQTKSNVCKEKNKTRKLVTSQSCLSRDVVDDENNVLDLIHKIVPADQMNLTTASNKRTNKSNKVPDDNWDVASVVSQCNSADGSDTYTDEEIFNLHNTIKKKGDTKKKQETKAIKTAIGDCKVVLQNVIKPNACKHNVNGTTESSSTNIKTINKGAVLNSVKSFWETDMESDIESHSTPAWKQKTTINQVKEPLKETPNVTILQPEKRKAKGSMITVRGLKNKINNKTILNEVKKPSASPQKVDMPKEMEPAKPKAATNKKTATQTKKATTKPNESVLNTRSTRNSKKLQDCFCSDDVSNDSNTQTKKMKQKNTAKPTKTVKPKANKKCTPKDTKCVPKTTIQTRRSKELQSVLNTTHDSGSSINISGRSLRSMKRLENSKENIEPIITRSWSKNIDDEQIFPEKSVRANGNSNLDLQKKRLLDEEESISERKRSKIDNNFVQSDKRNDNQHSDFDDNDFMFKKPSMPVRKSNKTQKHNVTEVLISKSSQQLTQKMNQDSDSHTKNLQDLDSDNNNQTVISQNSSDVSMKPSFIKRKLFTQKLDLLENKNLNSDLAAPSPQTKSNVCKEKNKTRKLVTSQSCLSRDVVDDENNVLDLIHKIVPADQMNLTTASNKRTNKSNKVPDDNWDVASVVSQCNSADGSDTYTDEEIFNLHNTIKKKGDTKKKQETKAIKTAIGDCKVVLQNVIKPNACKHNVNGTTESSSTNIKTINKGAVLNSVKSFWETDMESDIDSHSTPAWKQKTTINQVKEPLKETPNVTILQPEKRKAKGSMITVRGLKNKINNKTILNEVKKPSASPQKVDMPKEMEPAKPKAATNKKTARQTKKATTKPNESVLNTRSTHLQKKRLLDEEESISERKRSKIDNNFVQSDKRNDNQHSDFDDNDFMFKKPSMPVRKSNKTQKHNVTEVLISKSSQQLTQKMNQDSDSHTKNLQDLDSDNNNQTVISQNSSDVSMKPSFIKRKLFTQKLDLLENKNLNSDLAAPSPQTKSNVCKEKNKTRKLVTSQSCLSRDVVDDENNVLDLIHKIVPADQMNLTTASNKRTNKSNKVPDDNWDVASVVSQCNSADGSDTYTDEEIFNVHNTIKKKGDTKKKQETKAIKTAIGDCKVVLQNVIKPNACKHNVNGTTESSSTNIKSE